MQKKIMTVWISALCLILCMSATAQVTTWTTTGDEKILLQKGKQTAPTATPDAIITFDPEQRYQVAQMFGMGQVLGAQDEDVRYAAGEWEELLAWQPPVDPMTGEPFVDPNMAAQGKPWPGLGKRVDVLHLEDIEQGVRDLSL